jgi:hypothetical protein
MRGSRRSVTPHNNQVHLTWSAGETVRPMQVTWVFGRRGD